MFEIEFIRTDIEKQIVEEVLPDTSGATAVAPSPEPGFKNILLKGQMKLIEDINAIIYLCSPV